MKPVLVLLSLMVSAQAFAGTGDIGSVGGVRPSSVVSTSDKIEKFNSQSQALSIVQLCKTLSKGNPDSNVEWAKNSQLTCYKTPEGLVELRAENNLGKMSIYANANDLTVIEYFGTDFIYTYSNNLGQSLRVHLSFENRGVKRSVFSEAIQTGVYHPDILLFQGTSKIRVGNYIQEYNP